ncbi:MAG: hypothetical protein F6K11_34260, partial [Leptolyngbya sp. SIO3F4]|nr:hypothetical protein [Leptolyngbya sp. SIO3F4]
MAIISPMQEHLWYTLGPASLGKEQEMFLSGASGVRLTFSFGTPEIQYQRATSIKESLAKLDTPCKIVADLAGEKFRLGTFKQESNLFLNAGTNVRLICTESTDVSPKDILLPVPHLEFFNQLRKKSLIIIGDGSATLEVTHLSNDEVVAEMIYDGVIDQCRGLFIQDSKFQPSSLTTKDLKDLEHILEFPAYDAIALSFVSSENDIKRV